MDFDQYDFDKIITEKNYSFNSTRKREIQTGIDRT